jgi:signal transduction histidine kinase
MRSKDGRLLLLVAAVALCGATTLVVGLLRWTSAGYGGLVLMGIFTGLLAVNSARPVVIPWGQGTESIGLDEGFLAAMVLLLPPSHIIVVFALANLAGWLWRRLPALKLAFNFGQLVAAAGLGLLVAHSLGLGPGRGPGDVVAALAGVATFSLANAMAMAVLRTILEGRRLTRALADELRPPLLLAGAGAASVGILVGLVGATKPWALPFALVGALTLHLSFAALVRAVRDRERLDGLFRAAFEAHASLVVQDVRSSVEGAARSLLRCREARIGPAPPGPDDGLGAPLSERRDQWLVVSGRPEAEPFDPADLGVLETLAAVAGSALSNASMLETIRRGDEDRRRLLSMVVSAEEEERRRIAEDIHDDSVQIMVAVQMRLDLLRRRLADPDQAAEILRLEETTGLAVTRLRRLLFELRPLTLDRAGLMTALEVYADELFRDEQVDLRVDDKTGAHPSPEIRVILYRMAQEALANVRKHAHPSVVEIVLEGRDDGFLMRIHDDGAGFSPEEALTPRPGHLGLAAMRERAESLGGWWRVESEPGRGTLLEVWIPGSVTDAVAAAGDAGGESAVGANLAEASQPTT